MMKNSKTKSVRTMIGIVIALGVAGTFFTYLGAAPGYEAMFRALMLMVLLSIVAVACKALTTIKNSSTNYICSPINRQFYNITLSEECK